MSVAIEVSETASGMSIKAEELLELLLEKRAEIEEAIEKGSKRHLNIYINFNETRRYTNITEFVESKIGMGPFDLPKDFELRFYSNYPEEPYIEITDHDN